MNTQRRIYLKNAMATALAASPLVNTIAHAQSAAALEAKAPPLPKLGSAFKVPRITLLDGSVFDPAKAEGQPLLVYWWASTCPFCALQSPSMDKLWRSQKSRGLQMLALSIDLKPEPAVAYLKAKGYSFPAAWASPEWRSAISLNHKAYLSLYCAVVMANCNWLKKANCLPKTWMPLLA